MKALQIDNGRLVFKENCTIPVREKSEALIRVTCAGICNTDLEILKGYRSFSGIPGHEFVGTVESADEKSLLHKRVVGEINCSCNACDNCRQGRKSHCSTRKVLGIMGKAGAFAEYITLPAENLHMVPDALPDRTAVFTEPLAAALRILEAVHIKPSHSVTVIGDGKLGLLAAFSLTLTGCSLTVVGHSEKSRRILQRHRIDFCFEEGLDPEPVSDVVVECSGTNSGFALAGKLVKPMGQIVLKSTVAGNVSSDMNAVVVDEITLVGSRCGPFKPALNLLEKRLVDTAPLLDSVYSLNDGMNAFKKAAEKGVLKVLIEN